MGRFCSFGRRSTTKTETPAKIWWARSTKSLDTCGTYIIQLTKSVPLGLVIRKTWASSIISAGTKRRAVWVDIQIEEESRDAKMHGTFCPSSNRQADIGQSAVTSTPNSQLTKSNEVLPREKEIQEGPSLIGRCVKQTSSRLCYLERRPEPHLAQHTA